MDKKKRDGECYKAKAMTALVAENVVAVGGGTSCVFHPQTK
jgi:hypothetical protein